MDIEEFKKDIAERRKVWAWVSFFIFLLGFIVIYKLPDYTSPLYFAFGGAIATWATYKEIAKKLSK